MNKRRAVFLDLNGTLVLPLKQESLDEMTLIPGADVAVKRLLALGFVCPVVTVQARIEKGLFVVEQARASAAFIGDSIAEAVAWIVRREQKQGESEKGD